MGQLIIEIEGFPFKALIIGFLFYFRKILDLEGDVQVPNHNLWAETIPLLSYLQS
jgi:hypothetical protein